MILKIEHLTKRFGGLTAVDDVSFQVRSNEIVGLVGPNGSGKTTLFNCVSGILPLTSGEIVFQNRVISGLKPHQICRVGVGRTFQLVKPFFSLTALENVILGMHYGRKERSRKEAIEGKEILDFMGLGERAGTRAGSLILAERKKLEIARALGTAPALLLLDEVAAGLNELETEEMITLLGKIRANGVTILVVEHVMAVVMGLSDRIVVLSEGSKIAEGTPDIVTNDPRVIDLYLGEALDSVDETQAALQKPL
jgi:branched-chain amino acid transport system ATP-binding protein